MSISSAGWTDGLGVLGVIVLGGFLFGLAMSYSRWSGLFPLVQSLVVGLVWVLIWVGRTPEIPDGVVGAERVVVIGQDLWNWFMLLFGETPARSNLVFILELAILMWWLGYLSAWAVFREGRVWRAIIPIGLVLVVNVYFGPSNLGFHLAIFIICALLLAVRSNLSEQEINWRIEGIRYPTDIQFDFLRDGLILAVVVMLLAFFLPNAGGNGAGLGGRPAAGALVRHPAGMGSPLQHVELPGRHSRRGGLWRHLDTGRRAQPGQHANYGCAHDGRSLLARCGL
ncbi:MAG: hypothetical protein R2844_15270 [Caldilineales bacterium]